MDRFPMHQTFDRSHGPAFGAPTDGISQGTPYGAVIQSAISEGTVQVSIPALHLSQTMLAYIQPGTPCSVGESCLVVFGEKKIPWVTTGAWASLSLATLEAKVAALEAKLADSGWIAPVLLNSWVNLGGSRVLCGYRKQGNIVRLRGTINTGASGTEAFVLPVGFRPTGLVEPASSAQGSGTASHVEVAAAGGVVVSFSSGPNAVLDGVTFTTD
jgi:hypothetical protein